MAKLPKWPKKPKSNKPEILERWKKRTQEVAARRKAIRNAPEKARKIKDDVFKIRMQG